MSDPRAIESDLHTKSLRALLAVDAYLEREFADDPAQRDSGCELARLHDYVDAALDAFGLYGPEMRQKARDLAGIG